MLPVPLPDPHNHHDVALLPPPPREHRLPAAILAHPHARWPHPQRNHITTTANTRATDSSTVRRSAKTDACDGNEANERTRVNAST